MSDIIIQSSAVPSPAVDISIRVATLADLPAIDSLQKKYHRQLGFFPRAQMEEYLRNEWVLLAEEPTTRKLLGYCASRDRYLKRDELGVIYQLCVDPGVQRKFVGAALLAAVFERAPYGCRLFCCWCAQDIAANYFWESMGFVPLAFRAGSAKKSRVHIFWQKRIVRGDESTAWWFPSQTNAGAMGEGRLVLPIPPGVRWSDQMPRILPALSPVEGPGERSEVRDQKPDGGKLSAPVSSAQKKLAGPPPRRMLNGWSFAPPAPVKPAAAARARRPRERMKNDPKLIATARDLRDRWLEKVNDGHYLPAMQGKYDLGRSLNGPLPAPVGLLEAA